MRKLCEEKGVLFAVLWIVAYCLVIGTIKGSYGYDSPLMLAALFAFAAGICVFVKRNHLEKKYGLAGWPKDTKRFLYFIPLWILSTGNLWGGFGVAYEGSSQVFAIVSMLLIGYVEEVLFRGFLFKALIPKDGIKLAVIISSVTFGIGHIINLFAGQASIETVIQVFFAIAWGFIFTFVFYKCESLLPCIIAHSLVDAFSKFANESNSDVSGWIYMGATILVAIVYGIYLAKLPRAEAESEEYS